MIAGGQQNRRSLPKLEIAPKDGDVMEHEEIIQLHPETDEALEVVAARIRPLPRDVAPSAEFMSRTRLRLLELPPQAAIEESRRAA
jgi:hypothetical protein